LDLNIKLEILEIYKYNIKFDQQKIVVCNDGIIYLWNDDIIFVVDDDIILAEDIISFVRNEFSVQVYSTYYGIFVNRDLRLFKIRNNKLVSCKLEYDFWRDSVQPDEIIWIIDILMELCLFPLEICNVIYCGLNEKN